VSILSRVEFRENVRVFFLWGQFKLFAK